MNESHPPSASRRDAADVADAAALWLARRDRGFTPAERVEFERWVAHPVHAHAWREIEGPFAALDRAAQLRPRDDSTPDPDLLLTGSSRPRRVAAWTWLAGGFAAAAAVVVFGVLQPAAPVAPAPTPTRTLVVRNVPERVTLPDGSFIDLKAGTRVEPAFTATERRVRLPGGEAHFVVAKDAQRPFIVVIDDVEVRAVGTAFTIHASAATVEVVVTEGRVRVDDRAGRTLVDRPSSAPNAPPVLVAGHFVVIPTAAPDRAPVPVQPATTEVLERSAAWRSAWLEFGDTPLADVVREFNRHGARHSNLILKLGNDATGQVLVSGAFRADSAEAFVRLLESSFGITATPGTDGSVLLRRGP